MESFSIRADRVDSVDRSSKWFRSNLPPGSQALVQCLLIFAAFRIRSSTSPSFLNPQQSYFHQPGCPYCRWERLGEAWKSSRLVCLLSRKSVVGRCFQVPDDWSIIQKHSCRIQSSRIDKYIQLPSVATPRFMPIGCH